MRYFYKLLVILLFIGCKADTPKEVLIEGQQVLFDRGNAAKSYLMGDNVMDDMDEIESLRLRRKAVLYYVRAGQIFFEDEFKDKNIFTAYLVKSEKREFIEYLEMYLHYIEDTDEWYSGLSLIAEYRGLSEEEERKLLFEYSGRDDKYFDQIYAIYTERYGISQVEQ